jgi:hypothetical protein
VKDWLFTDWQFVTMFANTPACPLCSSKEFNVFHITAPCPDLPTLFNSDDFQENAS